jgi:hypothetical protein
MRGADVFDTVIFSRTDFPCAGAVTGWAAPKAMVLVCFYWLVRFVAQLAD